MSGSANDAVLGKHLNKLATRVANKLATISGGASVAVFTGAAANDGTSGLVPAPHAGDNMKFLRGDGTWAAFSGSVEDSVISADVSAVEGGFWQDIINDVPVLKLRHGDYEYNFNYDTATYLGSESTLVTVTPNTYVLDTAASTVDGGVWYEVNSNNVPQLKLHKGSYNYGFNYDSITYKGGSTNLVAYLPFDISTTADACGNEWVTQGSPTIDNYYHGLNTTPNYSCIYNDTIANSIGSNSWAVDFWLRRTSNEGAYMFGIATKDAENTYTHIFRFGYSTWNYNRFYFWVGEDQYESQRDLGFPERSHYAITYDGTTVRAFLNGALIIAQEADITLNGTLTIGGFNPGNCGTDAVYDHFRVWRTALWRETFTPPTDADYA